MDNLKEYIELKIKGLDKTKDFFEGQLIAYHDILDKISEHAPKPDNLVRIKDNTPENWWYSNRTGHVFQIKPCQTRYGIKGISQYENDELWVVSTGDCSGNIIVKEDCEIVND